MVHTCHAIGCACPVLPSLLMCRKHWNLVPKSLQQKVYAAYRKGQEVDKKPSAEYLAVAREAIAVVRKKESNLPPKNQDEQLSLF